MKNKAFILFVVIGALAIFVWWMKPQNQQAETTQAISAVTDQSSLNHTTTFSQNEQPSQPQIPTPDSTTSATHGETELFDTKSDLSIQPIDPDSDPGNQILENN